MGDIVNAVSDVFGFGPASKQADAVQGAANVSAQSNAESLALQRRMYEENVARQQPWLQAGQNALNQLAPMAANYQTFGQAQFQQDPGYAFRLSEGQKALERQASQRGGLISGSALKAATRYGQEMGSQEYSNAFNRYQTERNAQLNPLQSLAGVGQTTAQNLGGAGQNFASGSNALAAQNAANQGNAMMQQGNIRASQYGTAGSALNTAMNTDWSKVGSFFGGGGGYGSFGGGSGTFGEGEY